MRLTSASLTTLVLDAGQNDRIVFDDDVPGFGLRIRKAGSRVWVFQYKVARTTRRIVIGKASAIKPSRAREIAAEYHARVCQGGDPVTEKRVQVQRAAYTFSILAQRYLEQREAKLRPHSFAAVKRHLINLASPLHSLPIDGIDLRTVADLLSRIEKATGLVNTNRCRSTLSALFTWAMREGLVSTNPVANTNRREERSRDHVLTNGELACVLSASHSWDNGPYGSIIGLLTLTGQRRDEIGALRWSEVDFVRRVISLPGERTKNGRPHEIPMSPSVLSILSCLRRQHPSGLEPSGGYVFGRRPFGAWSRDKRRLDAQLGDKVRPWRLHDLRRSAATGMADIGIQPHVIEAVLNHVSGSARGGVAGIYNRASYAKEKAEALARWDEQVASIVGGAR
jgi:integrase